jgi:hypothetical protein
MTAHPYPGVTRAKNGHTWEAHRGLRDGRKHYLGSTFPTPEAARAASLEERANHHERRAAQLRAEAEHLLLSGA